MEDKPIYVIGHKNPDADAICSAIAYCAFKETQGYKNYIPARCGNLNARINTILNHFKVDPPMFLGDVTPRVQDIMVPADKIYRITPKSTYAEALELIDSYDVRALPVVDEKDRVLGFVSIFQLGEYFIPNPSHPKRMRLVHSSIEAIIRSLKAKVICTFNENAMEDLFIRVGVMTTESFGNFKNKEGTVGQSIVVVGNRIDIQEKAIDLGVRLLVVTGRDQPDEIIISKAKEKKVSLIYSDFDVAATAWLIRSATPIKPIIQDDYISFNPDEKIMQVRRRIANQVAPIYFVTDEDNKLLGLLSKTDILKPVSTKLVLVDHNELSQAINGADEVQIVEIIDHHRLGNPNTHTPIRFINEPYGSTSTIIANMYRSNKIEPSKEIAGILMGGLITDTLNLNSPTTTDVDREILPWLGKLAGISPDEFAQIVFNSGSIIINSSPEKVIESDCKRYKEGNFNFSVSQVEELGFSNFWNHSEDLFDALEDHRKKDKLDFSLLLVTDINTQNSLLVATGDSVFIKSIQYPLVKNHSSIFELEGIVSRKKQLMPYITNLIANHE